MQQHERMNNSKCQFPYLCDEALLNHPELVVSCQGESQISGESFGINPIEFEGTVGYADFLFSLTDNPFLFRGGNVVPTSDFIDSATETAKIILVFFTPEAGTTSLLTIEAAFMGGSAAEVSLEVNHYEMLEGSALSDYLAVQILVLIFVIFIIIDSVGEIYKMIRAYQYSGQSFEVSALFKVLTDFAACGMTIAFVSMRIPTKTSSASEAARLVGKISQIRWESLELSLEDKTKSFFNGLSELLSLINTDSRLDTFCSIILFVSLLRVIQCTALHPRLALLTGTVGKALDDLWHASLLILLLMTSFAGAPYLIFVVIC
jgi:hypothetical protein